jgi:hypothetical protein
MTLDFDLTLDGAVAMLMELCLEPDADQQFRLVRIELGQR